MNKLVAVFALLVLFLLAGCSSTLPLEDDATAVPTVTVSEKTIPVETYMPTDPTDAPTEACTEDPTEVIPFEVNITPVITQAQTQVLVKTADEFLAAIAPDTEIVVDAELIDLSTATGYGENGGDYYRWEETFDGPELYIAGVSNFTIRGNSEDHNAAVISSVPRYSNVLNFLNCSNVMVKGFTAGHTEEEGYCTGGVLFFVNCQDVLVEDCGLFGCGTVGVRGESSKNIQIINNDIYDCSYGGIDLAFCDNVNADGNTFRNLGGSTFHVYGCSSVTCNGEPVFDSYPGY